MQHHHLLLAGFGLAVLWAVCLLCRKSHPDDRASGTLIGQVSHAEDALQHMPEGRAALRAASADHSEERAQQDPTDSPLIRVCGGCWTVLGTSPKPVFPGQRLRLSTHETRAKCSGFAARQAEEDAEFKAPMARDDAGTNHAHAYSH